MAGHTLDINAKIPIIRFDPDSQSGNEKVLQNGLIKTNKLELPQPSFRKVPRDVYMRRIYTAKSYYKQKELEGESKDCYYHYEEPSPEVLYERVEYDMDLEDINWLEKFNTTYGDMNNYHVSENEFEKIMDRLEKESFFDNFKSGRGSKPDIDEDAVCAVCDNGDCNNANAIIFCDMCDLAVHQECYGVPYVPLGQWLCKRCQLSPAQNVECCLCPNLGGAFKQTELTDIPVGSDNSDKKKVNLKNKKGWAHVICALWVPEVAFANTVFLEPIEGIENIDAARWKLKCYICNQRYSGACIQCSRPNCYQPFHVTCAKQAGLYMRISPCQYERDGEIFPDVRRSAYCDKHTPSGKKCRGGGMYSGDESDEDVGSERYRKKEMVRKKNIRKTREKLQQQLIEFKKEAAIVMVEDSRLRDISRNCFVHRGKRSHENSKIAQIKLDYVERIHAYWLQKRKARNGVPLLRRLQVSYSARTDLQIDRQLEEDKYTKLRYDLEKARLLLGMMKKRERLKTKALRKSMEIIKLNLEIIDKDHPASEE